MRKIFGWAVVAVLVVGSFAAALLTFTSQEQRYDRRQSREVNRVAHALEVSAAASLAQLQATSAFVELQPGLTAARFRALTGSLLEDQPLQAFTYVISVPAQRAAAFERRLGLELTDPKAKLIRDRDAIYPALLTSSEDALGRPSPADSETAAHLAAVIGAAGDSGEPAISRASSLAGVEGPHLLVAHPVGGPESERGFVTGTMSVASLLESAGAAVPEGTAVALAEDGTRIEGAPLVSGFAVSPVTIADRTWQLRLVAPDSPAVLVPLLVGTAGLLLAIAIGLLLLTWSRRERAALELARQRVAERDRALRAEAEANRMYRLMTENMTDLVLVADPEGRITYASPAADEMLGWSTQELIGRLALDLVHPEDRTQAATNLELLAAGPEVITFEHRFLTRDGTYRWVETAARSIEDPDTGAIAELQASTRDISERKPLQDRLERLAREDSLTGLENRRRFQEQLETELSRSRRSGSGGAVLMIDIDHFKAINDSYGHLAGDAVIRSVAEALKLRMRATDTLARLGGDEFAAILPDTDAEQARVVAESIAAAVKAREPVIEEAPLVTVSIGFATFDGVNEVAPERLVEMADGAMYAAKAAGRDGVRALP